MGGRSHDYYCRIGKFWWSPFNFKDCPDHGEGDCSFYDLNHEAETQPEPEGVEAIDQGSSSRSST